jgi:hypothetical protein
MCGKSAGLTISNGLCDEPIELDTSVIGIYERYQLFPPRVEA